MQRYIFKEDLRRFQDCGRKGWYGLGIGNKSKDQDPFLAFLGEEARSVQRASLELFEGVQRTSGALEERARQTCEVIEGAGDFVLFEPRLRAGIFVANPTFLIRKDSKLFVLQVAAKAGDERAHRDGKMLVTFYGNVRSEWKELALGLGYSCEVLRRACPGMEVSPWMVLPSITRGIGDRERRLASSGSEVVELGVGSGDCVGERRRDSLLRFFDSNAAVRLMEGDVADAMEGLEGLMVSGKAPVPCLRYACRNCEYRLGKDGDGFSQCWGNLAKPSPHLFDLHQLYSLKFGKGLLADRKIREGKTSLFDVSENELNGVHRQRQELQLRCARSGEEWIDPLLADEIDRLEWPIRFVDFETYQSALPWIEGAKPFELIPFQWSCHTLCENGTLQHSEWLHDGRGDPRRVFVETLREALGDSGSALIYTDYEIQVLDTLRRHFIEVSGHSDPDVMWIDELLCSGRVVDQHEWVMKFFCSVSMGGRTSLKKALPAAWRSSRGLVGDLRFSEYAEVDDSGSLMDPYLTLPELEISGKVMAIREGCGAMAGYRELAIGVGRIDQGARDSLRELMLAYCKLDTAAQVILFEWWRIRLQLSSLSGNIKIEAS